MALGGGRLWRVPAFSTGGERGQPLLVQGHRWRLQDSSGVEAGAGEQVRGGGRAGNVPPPLPRGGSEQPGGPNLALCCHLHQPLLPPRQLPLPSAPREPTVLSVRVDWRWSSLLASQIWVRMHRIA